MPKHLREPKYKLPAPVVKDVEIDAPSRAMTLAERATIKAMMTGDEKALKELNLPRPKKLARPASDRLE